MKSPERFFGLGLAAGTLSSVLVQLLALGPWRGALWGFHAATFLPLPVAIVGWVVALVVAAWLAAPQRFPAFDAVVARLTAWRVPAATLPVLAGASGVIYWCWRSRQTLLGDAWPLISELPRGLAFHERQPLSMALQHAAYQALGGLFGAPSAEGVGVATHTVALVNVVAGVLFVVVAWGLGQAVARLSAAGDSQRKTAASPAARPSALLVCGVLLAQGYVSLFCGYLETYAADALCIGLFLWVGLEYLRGALPLVLPLIVWVLAVGLHLSAIGLLPALLLLVGLGLARSATRRRALRDLLIGLVAVVVLDRIVAAQSAGYTLWRGIAGIVGIATSDQGSGAGFGYLLSARHWRDFVDAQNLIGPLAAGLFAPAFVFAWLRNGVRTASLVFLCVAAGTLLAASWAMSDPALGYARDWDLFAAAGVTYAVAGLALVLTQVPAGPGQARFLAGGLVVSLLQLAAWVGLNASEPRSLRRFATLPLGQGRTEVVLGNWAYRHGDNDAAVAWFEKAVQVDPRNSNAYAFLGQIDVQRGRMDRAAVEFGRAAQLRPDKLLYRHNYVKALEALGRGAETLPHYEFLCANEPDYTDNWLGWAAALRATGQETQARAALERGLARCEARERAAPNDPQVRHDTERLRAALGRSDPGR